MNISRRVRSLLLMLAVNGIATGAFVVNTNFMLARETELTEARMRNDSLLVAEWLETSFRVTDYALRDILGHVRRDDLRYPHPDPAAQRADTERITAVMQTVPNAFLVGLFDERCVVTHTNVILGFDASEREYCTDLRDDPSRAVTVSPVYLNNTGDLNITIARRLPSDDGSFVGMAALGLQLDAVDRYLDNVTLAPGHHISVLDDGGTLIGRRPISDALQPGTRVATSAALGFVDAGAGYVRGRTLSPTDDTERLYVARPTENLPFVVVRSTRVDAIGASWRPYITAGWFTYGLLWVLGVLALRGHWRNLAHADALEELAHTDDLTGLANRRSFVARATHELERAKRQEQPLALALVDLDGLKTLNDRYGHAVCDAALQAFADTVRAVTRRIDVAARVGGDEFALLLPDTSADAAHAVAERLRDSLRGRDLRSTDGAALPLSISVGLVALTPATECDLDTLLSRADSALYQAKRDGRDRLVLDDRPLGSSCAG